MYKVSTKACYFCGIRKPQPEMTSFTIEVESGRSKPMVSASTIFGAVSGNKRSKRSLQNAIFRTNERKYYRKNTVWSCNSISCIESMTETKDKGSFNIKNIIYLISVLFILIGIFISYMYYFIYMD